MYGRRGQASVYQVVSIFLDMPTTFVFGSAIELRSAEIYESFIIGNECSASDVVVVFIEELARIVTRSATLLGIEIAPEGALEIASRSRGTPRIANRLLRRVRDFAEVYHDGVITKDAADHALSRLEVDFLGLDTVDRRMLEAIIRQYGGGPVGLETLAATIGEEAVTLEDVYEPYLMQIGFLTRTPRGRCVTRLAYDHLHIDTPTDSSAEQLRFQ